MIEGIDWNELWKKATLAASWKKRRRDTIKMWDRRAKRFSESVRRTDRAQRVIQKIKPNPEDTILDIGAGPGTLAIPLGKILEHVTTIEPSKGMLECLRENAQMEGLANITFINKKWEDVKLGKDIGKHDIAIASHSLVMTDIKEALSKMNEAVKRSVYLLTIAGRQTWGYGEIWSKLYGEEFVPGPDYIYIVNVLYQMGIYANIELWEYEFRECFSSLDEAVGCWKENFDAAAPEVEEIIREYLSQSLTWEGGALWSKRKSKAAMIWWEKEKE